MIPSSRAAQRLPRLALGFLLLLAPGMIRAQQILRDPSQVISVPKGTSVLMVNPSVLARFSIGDEDVAQISLLSPTEILVNGKAVGSTTLILWDVGGGPRLYSIEVTVDAPALERYLRALLEEDITVMASGNSVTLAGNVRDPLSVDRAVAIAEATGASVIDNLVSPPARQVLLQVRFAEVNRSAVRDFATAFATLNPHKLDSDGDWVGETISDGLVRILLSNPNADIEALIRASISKGNFRSLAEPNLLTLPGREASFLAGGEFPYPSIQSGQGSGAVGITFKEFGIRLKFTPYITRSGAIRLRVMPEVSSLDFANGLVISGFAIPSLLTRRAETEVELREGQFLALAGLIDNSTLENVTKIPILGDIPILGHFFRSTSARSRQTELLVLITPRFVVAGDVSPALPTGEPVTWKWPGWMRRELERRPAGPPGGL